MPNPLGLFVAMPAIVGHRAGELRQTLPIDDILASAASRLAKVVR
jgi:hypothetical protein